MQLDTVTSGACIVGAPIAERARIARAHLSHCEMCEWRCGADRTRGEPAPCHLGEATHAFNEYLSLTEEAEVRPALRVYFGGCNFRCRFCDTAPQCFEPRTGRNIEPESTAIEWASAIEKGAKTISVLGGEPTLHLHTLLALSAASPRPLPLAINTNLYMTPEVIELLYGVVQLYLGDYKFGNDDCAQRLASVARYTPVVQRNLKLITPRTKLIVRHLLMPGHFDCCFRPVATWVAENLPRQRFQLYTGYVPCFRAGGDERINRLNNREDIRKALRLLQTLDLDWDAGTDGQRTKSSIS